MMKEGKHKLSCSETLWTTHFLNFIIQWKIFFKNLQQVLSHKLLVSEDFCASIKYGRMEFGFYRQRPSKLKF